MLPWALMKLYCYQPPRSRDGQSILQHLYSYPRLRSYKVLHAMQKRKEFLRAIELVASAEPAVGLEIGTASGGTLFAWSHFVKDLLVSVDLPRGPFGGGYESTRMPFYKAFRRNSPHLQIALIRGLSFDCQTTEKVKSLLDGRDLDFLFIDGDHTARGVSQDLFAYLPMVKDGGLVIMHDIAAKSKGCNVGEVWDVVRAICAGDECVDRDTSAGLYGIGWFYWRRSQFKELREKLAGIIGER